MKDKNTVNTPAMRQYYEIKSKYPDTILFFRMGDFYEMFDDDAVEASKILGITLTLRNKSSSNPVKLCGIPYHAYLPYLTKLLKAGKKVAICEQLEDAKESKGIVKRGVTKILTPATVVEEEALHDYDNNFLLSVYVDNDTAFIAAIDVSTGEVYLKNSKVDEINEAFTGISIREVISNIDIELDNINIQIRKEQKNYQVVLGKVLRHYNVSSEKMLHIDDKGFIKSLALALDYLDDLILRTKLNIPITLSNKNILILDSVAVKTLEIVENNNGSTKNTLFSVLNQTLTPMGSRHLKKMILHPLRDINKINNRLDMIEYLVNEPEFLNALQDLLKGVYDLERITSRLLSGRATPRDLIWLKISLTNIPNIKAMLLSADDCFNYFDIKTYDSLRILIENAIIDEPPINIKEGNIIKTGYNIKVDEYKEIKDNSRKLLSDIEKKERVATGINQLKINYNKILGFFIEVSKSNISKVPDYFERKQTLISTERYITKELQELENKILSAEEKLNSLEYEVFLTIRKAAGDQAIKLRELGRQIAELDCIVSLSMAAIRGRYKRPIINNNNKISIKDGRHPVVESVYGLTFVPNDYLLDTDKNKLLLITGPNMSGKSTYLRGLALIVIMAHIGSFVPASYAEISILDRIFTRVGANDNLSKGESTFMVEMVETANILKNATQNSLIILDEIGRGTSTFDGVSIAWSVAEYIINSIGAKTLFATHYHELTEIADISNGVQNYTFEVQEWKNEIIFLRKVVKGTADKSYGIYVAKLAGLPSNVVERAEDILGHLEKHEAISINKTIEKKTKLVHPILVFDNNHPVIDEIKKIDVDNLNPADAVKLLHSLKNKADL